MSMGPPRGCAMSPTRRPGQPLICGTFARASAGRRPGAGWPHMRLRDRRITCQVSPSIGQSHGAGDAALGVAADRLRRQGRRGLDAPEQLACGRRGIVRMRERRQRLRVEGALVLRQRPGRGDESASEEERERMASRHGAPLNLRFARCEGRDTAKPVHGSGSRPSAAESRAGGPSRTGRDERSRQRGSGARSHRPAQWRTCGAAVARARHGAEARPGRARLVAVAETADRSRRGRPRGDGAIAAGRRPLRRA